MDLEFKIAKIEAENRELKAQVSALEAKVAQFQHFLGSEDRKLIVDELPVLPPPVRAHREPEVGIYEPVAPVFSDAPSESELRLLREICRPEFPDLCDSAGYVWAGRGPPDKEACEEEYLLQFGRSILALGGMRKLPKPDSKRYASSFVEHAQTVLRSAKKYTKELRSAPFFMAAMCMGVPISGLGVATCSASLGLSMFDGVGEPIDPGSWRAVLKAGRLPRQFPVERIVEQPSPARVYGAGY